MDSALSKLRKGFGISQSMFAGYMGIPLRTYEDLEAGRSTIRLIHIRAAQFAALQLAADGVSPHALPENLALVARNVVENLDAPR